MTHPEVLVRVHGSVGRLTLNRPQALNALTINMVHVLTEALSAWEHDPDVRCVVLDGAGDRGLCAGGDIRAIYDAARCGDPAPRQFWAAEYRLNARIHRYPKPFLALMDGTVMGGGVGVSAHARIRIVTERTKVGMPEVGIGFVPDAGGTYLLSRAPGELGTHVALTGARLGPGEAIRCGFADHFVPSDAMPKLLEDVVNTDASYLDEVLQAHAQQPPVAALESHGWWIDDCYRADTVEEILQRLRDADSSAARQAAEDMLTKSPLALKVTLRALRNARGLTTLHECLEQEYGTSCALLDAADLVEGIRAQVVDKDRNPRWNPPDLTGVSSDLVEKYFAPSGNQLGLAEAMRECDE